MSNELKIEDLFLILSQHPHPHSEKDSM